ncbi:MAG: acyl-CoA dehydrogenase family protein, partial [Promethearchaeota archaeon]
MYDFMLEPEDLEVRDRAREFARTRVDRQLLLDMDAEEVQFPRDFLKECGDAHILGIRFPEKYGGCGRGWRAEAAAIEEIAVTNMSLACLYSLVSICGEALMHFGTEEQRQKYLVPTLAGKLCCGEALTEPRGGSDFFGATTKAVRDGDEYVLNGQKRFVVGAEGADYFLVYARTSDDPNVHRYNSISLFIVEKDMGVETKYVYGLMGTRGGGAGRLLFRDVRVPAENVVLEEGAGGKIFNQMMIPERMTTAAGGLGMAREALRIAAKYSTKRKAFGQHINRFQGVSFKIADGITKLDAMRASVDLAARAIDSNQPPGLQRRLVSQAKRVSSEGTFEVVSLAMQVMGGIGYTNVYPIERIFRDARLASIWTGTSEIMNLIIQHEYYRELAAEEEAQKVRDVEQDAAEAHAQDEKIF